MKLEQEQEIYNKKEIEIFITTTSGKIFLTRTMMFITK